MPGVSRGMVYRRSPSEAAARLPDRWKEARRYLPYKGRTKTPFIPSDSPGRGARDGPYPIPYRSYRSHFGEVGSLSSLRREGLENGLTSEERIPPPLSSSAMGREDPGGVEEM